MTILSYNKNTEDINFQNPTTYYNNKIYTRVFRKRLLVSKENIHSSLISIKPLVPKVKNINPFVHPSIQRSNQSNINSFTLSFL